MKRRLLVWFSLSLLIGVLTLLVYSRQVSAPELANDSYQYLDAASHLAATGCLCTDVAHFDEQVRWGRMPIPFTHFGPGYPVAIAALQVLGLPGDKAGFFLSAASYLLVICFIWVICLYLQLQPWCIGFISLLWSLNPVAVNLAVVVGADSLFTAVFMALCALVAYDIRHLARSRPFALLLMGALAGAAYWLRQPGLFLVPPLCLYLLWRSFIKAGSRLLAAASLLIAFAFIIPVILHNIIYAHSWNSGFANGRHTPWKEVVSDTLKAPYHIIFGFAAPARLNLWTALFALGAAIFIWRVVTNLLHSPRFSHLPAISRTIFDWLLVFGACFASCILVAEFATYAAEEVRYNFPVLPIVLIACAVLFQIASDRIGRAAAVLCVVAVSVIDGQSLAVKHSADQSSLPIDLLEQQLSTGQSMQAFLKRTLPPGSVLVATEGQAVYYLLKRPVVSIIEPQYSLHTWSEADVHSVMRSFGAQYFLVFPGAGKIRAPEQQSSPFLLALTDGAPPSWLHVAARTPGVILYRCDDCSKAQAHSS